MRNGLFATSKKYVLSCIICLYVYVGELHSCSLVHSRGSR